MDIKENIAAHLKAAGGQMLCDKCIAAAIGVLHADLIVQRMESSLKSRELQRGIGICAVCKDAKTVTKAV